MRHWKILAVIAGVLTCAAAQAGDVYKYTDERGNTMYTDRPMPGAVRVASATPRPAETAARSYAAQQAATNNQLAASNAYEDGPYGLSDIAAQVAKDLPGLKADHILIASDHTHSGPDTIGVWGGWGAFSDPSPRR